MRHDLLGLVAAQMAGYMFKTGGCPQPGDIKNMVTAAERAVLEVDAAADRVAAELRKRDEARNKVGP